jgi:hypothetical protein
VSCGATGVSDAGGDAGSEPVEVDCGDPSVEPPGAVASPFAGAEALESGLMNRGAVLVSELCDEQAQHTSASAVSAQRARRPNEDMDRMPEHLTLLSRRERRVDELRDDCDSMNGQDPKSIVRTSIFDTAPSAPPCCTHAPIENFADRFASCVRWVRIRIDVGHAFERFASWIDALQRRAMAHVSLECARIELRHASS